MPEHIQHPPHSKGGPSKGLKKIKRSKSNRFTFNKSSFLSFEAYMEAHVEVFLHSLESYGNLYIQLKLGW
jgi:hypothetical protein